MWSNIPFFAVKCHSYLLILFTNKIVLRTNKNIAASKTATQLQQTDKWYNEVPACQYWTISWEIDFKMEFNELDAIKKRILWC